MERKSKMRTLKSMVKIGIVNELIVGDLIAGYRISVGE